MSRIILLNNYLCNHKEKPNQLLFIRNQTNGFMYFFISHLLYVWSWRYRNLKCGSFCIGGKNEKKYMQSTFLN